MLMKKILKVSRFNRQQVGKVTLLPEYTFYSDLTLKGEAFKYSYLKDYMKGEGFKYRFEKNQN